MPTDTELDREQEREREKDIDRPERGGAKQKTSASSKSTALSSQI